MNKSYILLRLYDKFREGKKLKIVECCDEYGISVSTFRRYIAFLREYFSEYDGREIIYISESAEYSLKKV